MSCVFWLQTSCMTKRFSASTHIWEKTLIFWIFGLFLVTDVISSNVCECDWTWTINTTESRQVRRQQRVTIVTESERPRCGVGFEWMPRDRGRDQTVRSLTSAKQHRAHKFLSSFYICIISQRPLGVSPSWPSIKSWQIAHLCEFLF